MGSDTMGETTTTCGDLPLLLEDFLIKILVCLPVKSLLRFKSVCKSWRQLIQTSFFIDLHTTTSSSKFGTFIFQGIKPPVGCSYYFADVNMFTLSYVSDDDGTCEDNQYQDEDEDDQYQDEYDDQKKMLDDLGFLPFYKDFQLENSTCMVGSCNGIICLHDPEAYGQHYSNLRDVYLWNPATREFRILPKSIHIEKNRGCDLVAFGFDVKTKDYKVLRITHFVLDLDVEGCMCRVQVYSLSTDSWRLLEGINSLPIIPTQGNHGIYLNGSYFFVGRKSYRMCYSIMMLSFDFTKEIFTTMQLPDDNYRRSVLSYLGDKMAVFTGPRIDYDGGYDPYENYDIWVLNEQQGTIVVNKESLTKLHSFRIKTSRDQSDFAPRCISNNGKFTLISYYMGGLNLRLFNLVTKEAKMDFLCGSEVCRADVYKKSLVSIMGGGNGNVLLRWQLPTHGTTYKLNLDAPFIAYDFGGPFGIGLCLTSDTGGCIGVRSLRRQVRDAEEGEALAMLEAIKWAKKLELSPIIIESDSKRCVSFFMDDDNDHNNSTYGSSEALSLLRKAKLLLNTSELGISFQYCSKSCNYVADVASKLGRVASKLGTKGGRWVCKEWTADFPGEMVRSLSKDLCSSRFPLEIVRPSLRKYGRGSFCSRFSKEKED